MTRRAFGGDVASFVVTIGAASAALTANRNAVVTMWSAATGGSQYTDLKAADGTTSITSVTALNDGLLPQFFGPDGVAQLWANAPGAGERVLLLPTDPHISYVPAVVVPPSGDTTGATDLAAINAAITAGQAAGQVLLRAGTYWINGPILMKTGVELVGVGDGVTVVKLAANAVAGTPTKSMLQMSDASQDTFRVARITLDGNRPNQAGAAAPAINLIRVGNASPYPKYLSTVGHLVGGAKMVFENMTVARVNGDGIFGDLACSSFHFERMLIFDVQGNGINWQGGDSTFDTVDVGAVGNNGVLLMYAGTNRLTSVKCFGVAEVVGNGRAFNIQCANNTLQGCEAQENPNEALLFFGGSDNAVTGFRAQGNGGAAVSFQSGSHRNTVTGMAVTGPFNSYASTYAIDFSAGNSFGNRIQAAVAGQAVSAGWVNGSPVGNMVLFDNGFYDVGRGNPAEPASATVVGVGTDGKTVWFPGTSVAPWGRNAGGWIVGAGSAGVNTVLLAPPLSPDGTIQVRIIYGVSGTNYPGVVFRYTDDTHKWTADISPTGVRLIRTNASGTVINTFAMTPVGGTTYTLKAAFIGNVITIYLNGTQIQTTTDSFNATANQHGLCQFDSSSVAQWKLDMLTVG